jgi:ankyrin repeat protein
MDCLAVLLEEGFNPLLVDEDSGTSMFMCACECGRSELVEALLRRGLNFSGLDGAGRCCFHYAARCATHGMVDVILQNPSMTKCKISDSMLVHIDNEGDNILHVAGRSGAVIPLAVLSSDSWRTCLQQSNDAGHTPLHEACKARQHVVMRHYLSLGASAADLDSSGRSPLWLYLHRSTVAEGLEDKDFGEAALMLLKAGCDLYPLPLDAIDALKSTPLSLSESPNPGDFAVQQLDGMVLSEITAMCIARSDLETVVRLVISSLLYDKPGCRAMRSLLDRSTISLLGDKVYWGYSLLGWATALNSVDAVEFLLVYGGLPWNQKVDDRGNTCLHLAAMHDHEELIKKIVIKGNVAHIDAKNFSHSTAAMLAAKHGSFGALQLLYRRYGASARLALDGKYWGWVLALALQEVRVRN